MEGIKLNPNNSGAFDAAVHSGVPECGDLAIASKPYATTGGNPAVVISFTVNVDGKPVKVQAVTTLKLLGSAVDGLRAAHLAD